MLDRQLLEITVRECLVEIPLQRVQVARTIKIIEHDEAASIDVFAKIVHFVIGERHLAGFGDDCKRIIENFGTAECDNAIRHARGVDVRRFRNHLADVIVRSRPVVRPTGAAKFSVRGVLPSGNDKFRRRRFIVLNAKAVAEAVSLTIGQYCGQQNQYDRCNDRGAPKLSHWSLYNTGGEHMKKLVLLRHGESVWNMENRFTGWTDVDLSPKGIEEARAAGRQMLADGYVFDLAFTSVLKRAIRTLWLALDGMDRMWIPVQKTWRLNERHYGALQGLNKMETVERHGEQQVKIWRRSYDIRPPALAPDRAASH